MPMPNFIKRILDRLINFKLDLPKTNPPVFVASLESTIPPEPRQKSPILPPALVAPPLPLKPTILSEPIRKSGRPNRSSPKSTRKSFPILRLPFVAQKNVLWMLKLKDLISLSFLSKRSKRMIQYALPSMKAQYDCKFWSRKCQAIKISSRFGSYYAFGPNNVDPIIDLFSYPFIRVLIYGEAAIIHATEWIETHRQVVKEIVFLTRCGMDISYENLIEFVKQFIEFPIRLELVGQVAITISKKEKIRIEFLNNALKRLFKR